MHPSTSASSVQSASSEPTPTHIMQMLPFCVSYQNVYSTCVCTCLIEAIVILVCWPVFVLIYAWVLMPVWGNVVVHGNICVLTCVVWKCQPRQNMTEFGTDGPPVILSSFHSLTPDEAHRERERVRERGRGGERERLNKEL